MCESNFKVNMQIYQCVERPHVLWNLKIRSKTKLTEERFWKMVLFKTVLDYLLVAKNVRISYVYETHEEELISLDHCLFDFTAGKLRSFMLKILKVLRFDTNHLLNNTFWTSHYSHMIFTGPWNLHNVARPYLKSESSVFTLRPQFASLQRIVVLSAWKFDLSLLRLWYPLSSKKIIL